MHQHRLLTLLSDFWLERCLWVDEVIAQINCSLTVVDLTHQIPPKTSRRRGLSNECLPIFHLGRFMLA